MLLTVPAFYPFPQFYPTPPYVQVFLWIYVSFLLDEYLGVELMGQRVVVYLVL